MALASPEAARNDVAERHHAVRTVGVLPEVPFGAFPTAFRFALWSG